MSAVKGRSKTEEEGVPTKTEEEKVDDSTSICGGPARITTIGGGGTAYAADGDGALSVIIDSSVIAFDGDSNLLFATGQNKVMQLGLVDKTVAELCTIPGPITALAVNDEGTVYVATQLTIYAVSELELMDIIVSSVTAFAGSTSSGNVDAAGDAARFSNIRAMTFDGQQALVVVDGNMLRRVTQDERAVTTFCGNSQAGHVDGTATAARFKKPSAIAFDGHDGSIYVSDQGNHRIRRISPDLQVSTRAGDGEMHTCHHHPCRRRRRHRHQHTTPCRYCVGQARHLDGRATAASFSSPTGVAAVAGWVYVCDCSHTIRCLSPTGHVTTVAGSPGNAGFKDNMGDEARIQFQASASMAVNSQGLVAFTSYDPVGTVGSYHIRSFTAEQHTVPPAGESTLIRDLAALIKDEDQTDPRTEAGGVADLTVLSADGTPTFALRGLLMLRSTYFRTMLASGLKEGQSDTINLEHSTGAVKALLLYLHTDELEAPDDVLVELLEMSEMMDLPRLKAVAAKEVYDRIRADNACVFLLAAAQQNAADLREASIVYIANHFASVRKHSSFEELPKDLLLEVMMRI